MTAQVGWDYALPPGGRFFFSWTGLSHLFWVYEQRPGTEVMCVYTQLTPVSKYGSLA